MVSWWRILGLIVGSFFKFWHRLDDNKKKLIIEQIVKAFEMILRDYYKDNKTKNLIIERVIEVLEIMLRAFYKWWKNRRDK